MNDYRVAIVNDAATESDCPYCGKYIPDLFEVAAYADRSGNPEVATCPYCERECLLETYSGWTLKEKP